MLIEGVVIFLNQGFDKNFLLVLPLFMLFFTYWTLTTNLVTKDLSRLRDYSKYYFFLHPIPIFFVNVYLTNIKTYINIHDGWIRLIITLIFTHLVTLLIIKLKKRFSDKNTLFEKILKYL